LAHAGIAKGARLRYGLSQSGSPASKQRRRFADASSIGIARSDAMLASGLMTSNRFCHGADGEASAARRKTAAALAKANPGASQKKAARIAAHCQHFAPLSARGAKPVLVVHFASAI
jgi:hypothetical protein